MTLTATPAIGDLLNAGNTCVMGVLNVTPDSFSDGGRYRAVDAAVRRAREMVEEGAAIVDVGGESTRPGASPVAVEEELARVVPVIEGVRSLGLPAHVSVDTSKPEVMRAAVAAGASLINDVRALREPGALQAALECGVHVCLMHMQGEPRSMQVDPHYDDVVEEVYAFLQERVQACAAAGFARERLLIDPGIGFGKTLEHNLILLKHLGRFCDLGSPILVGLSRKRMIGTLLDGAPPEGRVQGSVAGAVIAAWNGASIIRAHDVRETAEALRICDAIRRSA